MKFGDNSDFIRFLKTNQLEFVAPKNLPISTLKPSFHEDCFLNKKAMYLAKYFVLVATEKEKN